MEKELNEMEKKCIQAIGHLSYALKYGRAIADICAANELLFEVVDKIEELIPLAIEVKKNDKRRGNIERSRSHNIYRSPTGGCLVDKIKKP